ncbi:LPXTG cell wall anchor domain-containing protein [Streptomyces sp. NPDC047725]|uniref:LPXTG cell wall anchor domain-containing protein n=1 Tax=Streptomyces sp. NPDC047725 TaxID=3365487 RepID=UPI00371E9E3A
MRRNLSKGMVVAGAATSILSLYATPAFAASDAQETARGLLGALSHSAHDLSADGAESHGSAQGNDVQGDRAASRDRAASAGYGDDGGSAEEASRRGGEASRPAADGRPGENVVRGLGTYLDGRDVARSVDERLDQHGVREFGNRVSEEVIRHFTDGRFGGHTAPCEEGGGYGDDIDTCGGYGDTPTTPVTPPTTTPEKPSEPPATPPASNPPTRTTVEQPPSLAQTGAGEELITASGVAALLMTSGVLLYRRGRAASPR